MSYQVFHFGPPTCRVSHGPYAQCGELFHLICRPVRVLQSKREAVNSMKFRIRWKDSAANRTIPKSWLATA